MSRYLARAVLAAVLIAPAAAAVAAGPAWLHKEFNTPGAVPLKEAEAFLNSDECRPSGLDGIQTLAVQSGHALMHLHVYCRQDKSAKARYRLSMPSAEKGKALGLVPQYVDKPDAKIGPFYFGENGGNDGFVLIEKIG